MNTQQQTQLLHLNHKHSSQLTLAVLVVVSSWLMGLVPLIYDLGLTETQGENFIIPTEAGLWSALKEASE